MIAANDDPKNARGFKLYMDSAMSHSNKIEDENIRRAVKDLVKAIEILAQA